MIEGKFYKHIDCRDLVIMISDLKNNSDDSVSIKYNMFNVHWSEQSPSTRALYIGQHESIIKKESLKEWKEYSFKG